MREIIYLEDDLEQLSGLSEVCLMGEISVTQVATTGEALRYFTENVHRYDLVVVKHQLLGRKIEFLIFYIRAARLELPILILAEKNETLPLELENFGTVTIVSNPRSVSGLYQVITQMLARATEAAKSRNGVHPEAPTPAERPVDAAATPQQFHPESGQVNG